MNEIVMPKLSDTMTEGRIVSWKKVVGDAVKRGDVLAEVETDKANMELEAFTAGVLLEIRIPAGELAQVGTVIAVVGAAGEKAAPAAQPTAAPQAKTASPAEQPEPATAPQAAPANVAPQGAPSEGAAAPGVKPEPPPVEAPGTAAPAAGTGAPAEGEAPAETQAPTGAQAEAQPASGTQQVPAQAQAATQPQAPSAPAAPGRAEARGAGPAPAAAGTAPHGERAAPVVRRRGETKGDAPAILRFSRRNQRPCDPAFLQGKARISGDILCSLCQSKVCSLKN
jgi:pyruvate dehydrogenase E2 component (dihydrolipoamide acetyltransferase)